MFTTTTTTTTSTGNGQILIRKASAYVSSEQTWGQNLIYWCIKVKVICKYCFLKKCINYTVKQIYQSGYVLTFWSIIKVQNF